MNNPKVLFFFTAEYPFGSGEAFIETEINHLAQKFEKIFIVSTYFNAKQTREVPANVQVINQRFELGFWDKLASLFGVFSVPVIQELMQWKKLNVPLQQSNFNYLLISYFRAKRVASFIKQLRLKHAINNDELYLYSYWWMDEAIGIARYSRQFPAVKSFSRAHGFDLYFERSTSHYLPLKMFSFESLNKLFFISENGFNYFHEKFKLKKSDKAYISRLGVKNEEEFHAFKEPEKEFVILSCSHIYPNKRVELIVEALLKMKDLKIKWIHFGEYIKELPLDYKNNFEKLLVSLKAHENIRFEIKKIIPNRELMDFYRNNRVDLFINVSESEGIPVSIMEAMSFGIPVLATNVGGTSEIVNVQNGCLLPPQLSVDVLAENIIKFIRLNQVDLNRKRQSAFETWNLKYNAAPNYQKFINQIDLL